MFVLYVFWKVGAPETLPSRRDGEEISRTERRDGTRRNPRRHRGIRQTRGSASLTGEPRNPRRRKTPGNTRWTLNENDGNIIHFVRVLPPRLGGFASGRFRERLLSAVIPLPLSRNSKQFSYSSLRRIFHFFVIHIFAR